MENKFNDRAKMNMEYASNQSAFGIFEIGDSVVVSANIEDDRKFEQPNQIEKMRTEFVKKIQGLEDVIKSLRGEKEK